MTSSSGSINEHWPISDANCDLNISHSGDVCTLTVDELVAFYRSEIEGVTEEIGTNAS